MFSENSIKNNSFGLEFSLIKELEFIYYSSSTHRNIKRNIDEFSYCIDKDMSEIQHLDIYYGNDYELAELSKIFEASSNGTKNGNYFMITSSLENFFRYNGIPKMNTQFLDSNNSVLFCKDKLFNSSSYNSKYVI
jgi:hypothetical protein